MKTKNIVISLICVAICGIGFLLIFQRHQVWTDRTFGKLINQNLESYSESQKAEVISKVEDIRATLSTVAELMARGMELGEDASEYTAYLEAISKNEKVRAKGVTYHTFADLETLSTRESDKGMIERLKNGESVVSNIYVSTKNSDSNTYFGIAEPVKVGSEYVGFIRGLINSNTLFYSSQTGFLSDETQSYLIHADGRDATRDFDPKEQGNVLKDLAESCENPDEIKKLGEDISKEKKNVAHAVIDGKTVYISYSILPYNDWVILNVSRPSAMEKYKDTLAGNGRKITFMVLGFSGTLLLFIVLLYFMGNKEEWRAHRRATLLMNFGDALLSTYDVNTDTIDYTPNLKKLLNITIEKGQKFTNYIEQSDLVLEEDRDIIRTALSSNPGEGEVFDYELRLQGADGKYLWCMLSVTGTGDNKRRDRQLLFKITDISSTKEKELGLLYQAQMDVLTGLWNRREFSENVQKHLDTGEAGYLFLIDIDNFKTVNDDFGHVAGDECLTMVAERLRGCFRNKDFVGRYGGDEFLAFIPKNVSVDLVHMRAKKVINAIHAIHIADFEEMSVTCSVGIAKGEEGSSFESLLKRADHAMYLAKDQGKNTWNLQE